MASSKYASIPEETSGLPRGIKYIIGNEAAERFSFYGMRTILVVFMTKYLHLMVDGNVGTAMNGAKADETYHLFVSATYIFPVLGSLLADIFIGKYRTILWLSIVYCLGHLALALMGGPGMTPASWLYVGLIMIAVGSGGIKPCVSAHVGDQFGKKNSHMMTRVYQWFYFAINFGSTASTALTPLLLEWYGPHVAFGLPGVLMALATLLFWMGRNVFIHVPAAGMNFFRETFSRDGVTALLKLSVIYAFVAVFWAVFDQTGSSWVRQAGNMDLTFLWWEFLPSQVQVVNPLFVLILIPLFQLVVYPAVNKVFTLTPLRKITIGFFLTAGSFVFLAVAQQMIDTGTQASVWWQLWAYVALTAGEVMISITGLEFSYTQAPKTMKSVVMAFWLASVSLGNYCTSAVNSYIQTPSINDVQETFVGDDIPESAELGEWNVVSTKEVTTDDGEKQLWLIEAGMDGKEGTADDVTLVLGPKGDIKKTMTSENEVMEEAAQRIEDVFTASNEDDQLKALPLQADGQKLVDGLSDSLGNQLTYLQVTRNQYQIVSSGYDEEFLTQWDVILTGDVSRSATEKERKAIAEKKLSWREQRIISILGEEGQTLVNRERGDIPETTISRNITVGGRILMSGAEYFWFWVKIVGYTGIAFIPVAYFYKEKSYIQSEQEGVSDEEATAEATDV
ncbi:MAG: POT family MFS transporter [Fuerstiella sp.]